MPVEVADRLGQLGPPGPEGGALVERDRLVDAALRGPQLGDVLVDHPVAGVRSLGALVVPLRFGKAAVTQVQEPPLHLDPGVLAELLGGDLGGGLGVERVGPVGVAQRPFEVRQPRKVRPRVGLGDQSLVGATRFGIAAELEVDVGLDRAAVGRAGEPLAQREARAPRRRAGAPSDGRRRAGSTGRATGRTARAPHRARRRPGASRRGRPRATPGSRGRRRGGSRPGRSQALGVRAPRSRPRAGRGRGRDPLRGRWR